MDSIIHLSNKVANRRTAFIQLLPTLHHVVMHYKEPKKSHDNKKDVNASFLLYLINVVLTFSCFVFVFHDQYVMIGFVC